MALTEPIRVFSDLHLGHPGSRITHISQLEPLLEGAATVVLNGDTAELKHSKLIPQGRALLADLKDLALQRGIQVTYLTGNHDPTISDVDHMTLRDGAVSILHGDAFFRYLSPWSRKLKTMKIAMDLIHTDFSNEELDQLGGRLEYARRCREVTPGYENEFQSGPLGPLRTLISFAWPPHRPWNILKVWLTAQEDADRFARRYLEDSRFLLFGHTHRPGHWERNGRVLINTGGFLSRAPARLVEISEGSLHLFEVTGSKNRTHRLGDRVSTWSLDSDTLQPAPA